MCIAINNIVGMLDCKTESVRAARDKQINHKIIKASSKYSYLRNWVRWDPLITVVFNINRISLRWLTCVMIIHHMCNNLHITTCNKI